MDDLKDSMRSNGFSVHLMEERKSFQGGHQTFLDMLGALEDYTLDKKSAVTTKLNVF